MDIDVSREEFVWGSDTAATRALSPDRVGGLTSQALMFPLFDLALHGDDRNIRCKMNAFSVGRTALKVDAARRIMPGDEILNWYIGYGRQSSWQAVKGWGFTTERCSRERKEVRLVVTRESLPDAFAAAGLPLQDGQFANENNFTLTETHGAIEETRALVGYLRSAVSVQGGGRPATSPAHWRTELVAAKVGKHLVEGALTRYPDSLEEDEALLAADIFDDARVKFMVMIRRDEKLVLHGWVRLLIRVEREAAKQLADCRNEGTAVDQPASASLMLPAWDCAVATVDRDYLESAWLGGWGGGMRAGTFSWAEVPPALEQAWLALEQVVRGLRTDGAEAIEQPIEVALLLGVFMVIVDGLVTLAAAAVQRCLCWCGRCGSWALNVVPGGVLWARTAGAVAWWMGLVALVVAAVLLEADLSAFPRSDRRSAGVKFGVVLKYERTLVAILGIVLEVGALVVRWLWRGCPCCRKALGKLKDS